jgi:HTH-type transcriptional regulator/antitoxin HigA
MDVGPIQSDEDHARAMGQVEDLWGAPPGSTEAETLDAVVT